MDYGFYRELLVEKSDRTLRLTINRPDALNVVTGRLHVELSRIFTDISLDEDVDVVVLTGAGKAFCAGGDIGWMRDMLDVPGGFAAISGEGKRIVNSLLDLDKPVVCRLNGDAVGLGATLALFCDVIIADEVANIADPHVRVGLVAGDGGAVIWPQLIGYPRAKELLLTGDAVNARDAATMGLINRAVPADQLDAEVDRIVQKLLRQPQSAMRWTKASVNIGLKMLTDATLEASIGYEIASAALPDHREAVTAFLEKRRPNFKR